DLEIRQRRRELLRSLERRKIDGNDTGRDAVFLFELEGEGLQPVLAARGEDARESRPRKLAGELRADPRRSTRHDCPPRVALRECARLALKQRATAPERHGERTHEKKQGKPEGPAAEARRRAHAPDAQAERHL